MSIEHVFPLPALAIAGSLITTHSEAQKEQEPVGQVKSALATKLA